MLTQCLDPFQIEDVSKEHEGRNPEYFDVIDKAVKFYIKAVRSIKFGSVVDVEVHCDSHSSPMNKIFIVEVCADRHSPSYLRNIIYCKETKKQNMFNKRMKFSINPYNEKWYSRNRIEVLCNLYDPGIGFVKLATHLMELKKFKIMIYTNIPLTEKNNVRKLKVEYKNLLPIAIDDFSIRILVECEIFTRRHNYNVNPFQELALFVDNFVNVGPFN
ncbi:hypothetical protein RF11_04696 [Thelohanellus kitauei]|uniref:Uncharacterized protein n=1 Tax=Thelohanellus kitauei TaxID=669202 RepID=A0A0C2MD66_THEKT|nr:hypothetical protein RF11_06881 [Thelohanellus kitauei]KII73314.1 hypothetical protein RF11_04696 [Thelohanellus kitauei]